MKKDYLLYLKKLAGVCCIVTSAYALTGCGISVQTEDFEVSETKEESKKDEVKYHDHLMVDIDGTTYIFRECEAEISDIKISLNYGSIHYRIYDDNNEKILDTYTYGDALNNSVDCEAQEQAIREIEDKSIENGAILYRGIGSINKN